jgi:hypothetical protein
MKKLIVAAMAFGLLSGNVFASTARVTVMGDGFGGGAGGVTGGGSFYYNDDLNVFYNPSYVNDGGNWATIEKAGAASFAGGVMGMGSMNLGVFFNQAAVASGNGPISVLLGMDSGVKWGVGAEFTHAGSGGNVGMNLKAGAQISDLDPFVHFTVLTGDNDANNNLTIGAKYHWGEWTPYAFFNSAGSDDTFNKATNLGLGFGRTTKVKDANLMYSLAYVGNPDAGTYNLPFSLSAEGDATSWLVLRGGFAYDLASAGAGARLGAGFKVAGAMVDWAVGGGGAEAANVDGTSFDLASGFFTNVGVTYKW